MKTLTFSNLPIRNRVIHLVILLVVLYMISLYLPLEKWQGEYHWQPFAQLLLIIGAFYIHSLVLLPVLLRKRNQRKYIIWTAIGFLVFWLLMVWLSALQTSATTYNMDWTRPDILEVILFELSETFWVFLIAFIPATAVSLLYYILLLNKEKRKELFFSKYVEPYINILLLIPIFILFIFNIASTIEHRVKLFYELLLFSLYFYLNACLFVKWLVEQKKIGMFLFLNILSFAFVVAGTAIIYSLDFLIRGYYDNVLNVIITFFIIFSLSLIYGYVRIKLKANEQFFSLKLGAKDQNSYY